MAQAQPRPRTPAALIAMPLEAPISYYSDVKNTNAARAAATGDGGALGVAARRGSADGTARRHQMHLVSTSELWVAAPHAGHRYDLEQSILHRGCT